MSDDAFLAAFESCAHPLDQWHHREHVKLAYILLLRYPLDEAIARARSGIKAYNQSKNLPDELSSGYHETMTQAWMRIIHATLCEYGPAENADAFYEQHPQLSQKKNLRLFYSRDRFVSWEAKRSFREPDLAPLPASRNPANFRPRAHPNSGPNTAG